LSFRIVPTAAWVRSDFILLERILFNLVSNAIRYTSHGGVLVGCRKRGGHLLIEIWDTGIGIPEDQRLKIFGEFYRLGEPDRDRHAGLGLGLAIVDRLCRLLNHHTELNSVLGRGSRFSVLVPAVAARAQAAVLPVSVRALLEISRDKLVVVVDDDPLVLDGMGGMFRSWGCRVVAGGSSSAALNGLTDYDGPPDLIISDFCLLHGETGIEVIERLRHQFGAPIPGFLISGDTNPDLLRQARARGFHLLHKPVDPMTLRAMLNHMLTKDDAADTAPQQHETAAGKTLDPAGLARP